ncbi:MAG: amidohydrolase family protein [Acidimicrobiales bacterium]|jgi:predicted TIM-barrel fold metal-dependent hydrolase
MPPTEEAPAGAQAGPYRRGALLRRVVPVAKRVRDTLRPGPRLKEYDPVSNLVGPANDVTSARFPVVDIHTHLGRWLTPDGSWMAPDLGALFDTFDALNVRSVVNLDGRWGDELEANLDRYDRAHPDRFATFCQLDFAVLDGAGNPDDLVRSLESSHRAGARGLKVWKNLGMIAKVGDRILMPDDPLLDPIWQAAGSLALPVLVHVADPVAFFQPMDRHNERLEELLAHPSISQAHHGVTGRHRIIESFEAVVASHPDTTFIGAHVGCNAENLPWVTRMLDTYPNFWIDTSARSDLGRQPRQAAKLIERHSDRVLFGADVFPIDPEAYKLYFRLLETEDEYFRYAPPGKHVAEQGRWTVSGLGLPGDVLEKLYSHNARRLLGWESPQNPGDSAKSTADPRKITGDSGTGSEAPANSR